MVAVQGGAHNCSTKIPQRNFRTCLCGRRRRGSHVPLERPRDAKFGRGYVEHPERKMNAAFDGRGLDSVVSGTVSVNGGGRVDRTAV